MLFDKEITNIADLLAGLADLNIHEVTWYRGQSDGRWKLVPSLGRRRNGIRSEMVIIKRFKQNAGPFLSASRPTTHWEWLMLMQHYRAKTRLLDWTESPLVGLYFATEAKTQQNAALWCLLPTKLNAQAKITFGSAAELPSFGDDQVLDSYAPATLEGERLTKLSPLAVTGARDTPRMYAQLGAFTVTHREQTPIEEVGDGLHIGRFTIPVASKEAIRLELARLSITKLTLFPELENVAALSHEVLK